MLPFLVGFAVALGRREGEPVADVGDAASPRPVGVCVPVAAAEALDDPLDVQEPLLGIVVVIERKGVVGSGCAARCGSPAPRCSPCAQ